MVEVSDSVACSTEMTPTSSDVALSSMLSMDWSSGNWDEVWLLRETSTSSSPLWSPICVLASLSSESREVERNSSREIVCTIRDVVGSVIRRGHDIAQLRLLCFTSDGDGGARPTATAARCAELHAGAGCRAWRQHAPAKVDFFEPLN